MPSYTDAYGRSITPINPQPGDPAMVLAPPFHDLRADQLLSVMADGGIQPYVMNYGSGSPLFLAFNFIGTVTLDALDAAQRISRRFEADAAFRESMVIDALQAGAAFHEWVQARSDDTWRKPSDESTVA